jgi:acetyl coenzyme A synthetase (ADP forming)-like protein
MSDNLFAPQSIAIVGASNKKGKIGTIVTENILKLGYGGKTFLVNPSYKMLKLKRCYAALSAIKKPVDVAIVCVPAKFVADVVKDGAATVKNFVIISAGFSENGAEGAKREKELSDLAKKHKLNILGPNCLGFIAPNLKLNASFAGGLPSAGNIAFVSQSGALAVAIMDKAKEEHLGFSNIISVGNKMQLDETALLEYLENDQETKVIGMYLEGIKDGVRFLKAAKKVSEKKPIVILKAGKTAKAQQAISSHTGALAGSDEIMDVAFASAGIIRANDLDDFFNLLGLISFADAPRNGAAAVITNAGGAGVLTTDAFKGKEIALAEFDEKTKKQLADQLPGESSVQNPVDLLGDAGEERYKNVLELLNKKEIGSIICVLTPQEQTPVQKIAEVIVEAKKTNTAAIATVFIGGERIGSAVSYLKQNNIPNFANPDSAVEALDKYYKWSVSGKRGTSAAGKKSPQRKKRVTDIIAKAQDQKRGALLFPEAAEIMELYGINCVKAYAILPGSPVPEVAEFPVVLKIDSDKVLHKSDKQALILNIKDKGALLSAIDKLQKNFPGAQLVAQPMQEKQTEIILGIKKDDIFGSVIVYGLGGIYTEVFKMVDFLIPPMSVAEIKSSILKGKLKFLFEGARGQAAYDADEFAAIVAGLMDFALENGQVREFDINPLFIYNDKRKASAVDVKIIL